MTTSTAADLVRERVRTDLQLHVRVRYQDLLGDPAVHAAMAAALPDLVPFGEHSYQDVLAILDWDHRLPSRSLILRLYGYYDANSAVAGRASYLERQQEIARRDRFPEFDVPDFEGLLADEAYEAVVDLAGQPERPRLVSEWRRHIDGAAAEAAVETARGSELFQTLAAAADRPFVLGDLEAVAWCPPCECEHERWTVDVWYLMDFDGLIGKGYSFVVDPVRREVVAAREFVVRAADTR